MSLIPEYCRSTYNKDGLERMVLCPAGHHVIKISDARRGYCPECVEEEEDQLKTLGGMSDNPVRVKNGIWCHKCLEKGKYSWVDLVVSGDKCEFYKNCPDCGTRFSRIQISMAKSLMKRRGLV